MEKPLVTIVKQIRLFFILISFFYGGMSDSYGQCSLNVQNVNFCNNGAAVLGVGAQLTILGVPSTNLITSYSWTGPNGFTSSSQFPVLPAPATAGNYTLTVQAPGCGSESQTLNVSSAVGSCPNAAFTQNQTTICDGGTISFTNQTAGSGNTYFWLFGDGATSTAASPTHTYDVPEGTGTINFTVTLVVTNAAGRMDIEQRVISVRQIPPEPEITSNQLQLYNGQEYLVRCTDNPTGTIFISGLANNPGAWAQSFTINWGDGSPLVDPASFTSAQNHPYASGLYSLTINMLGPNGCSISNTYPVFVGNFPAVNLGSPGNTEQCSPYTFNFPILDVGNNEIGTTYTVTFSDGGTTQVFNHPPPAFVSHTFTQSSCGETSLNNLPDAYWVQITAQNPCDIAVATIEPIRISTPPVASFTALPNPACINTVVNVNSTADPGTNVNSAGCNTNHGMVWSIAPSTGWNVTSGTLGSTNGQPTNYLNWTSGTDQLEVIFTTPGIYTITQRIRNSCGEDVETQTVCVVPPVTAAFNLHYNDQCAPETITTDNLTLPLNTCVQPTYLWSIDPAAPLAPNLPPYTLNSFEPAWILNVDTTYIITLAATNVCGTTYDDTSFTIVAPPTVDILPIPPGCAPYIVDPSVTYYDGGGSIVLQEWSIDNGPWQTIVPSEPVDHLPISFSAGTHTISVRITNECGTATDIESFVVTSPPEIDLSPFSVCSGVPEIINGIIPPVSIGTGAPPYSYNWTGTGIVPTTISNPTITLVNSSIPPVASVEVVNLIITDALGCSDTANVNVTVNPLPTLTAIPNSKCIDEPAVTLSVSSDILGTTFVWFPSTSLNTSTGPAVQANPSTTTTYTINGTVTATGCTSTTTTELTVNPLPVVDAETPILLCAQSIPTTILQGTPSGGTWSDPTPLSGTFVAPNIYTPSTTPGTDILTYTYIDANGCANSDNVQVTILTVESATVGADFALCQNASPQLLNSGLPAGGIWSGAGVNLQFGNYFFDPSIAGAGVHPLTYTINTGTTCESNASLIANVFQLPTVDAGLDAAICSGFDTLFSSSVNAGTPPYQYTWTPAIGVIGATNTSELSVGLLNQTSDDETYTYNLSVTDDNGCIVSDTVNLTIHPIPEVQAGIDQTVCTQPIPYTLNGFSPIVNGTGVWTGSDQLSGIIYTPLSSAGLDTLIYTFTDLNGCVGLDSMTILNIDPVFPDAGSDTSVCLNLPPFQLNAINPLDGVWSGPGVTILGVFNPSAAGIGIHQVVYTVFQNTTCQTSDTIEVEVIDIPQVDAGLPVTFCSGDTISLLGSIQSGIAPFSIQWSPSGNILGDPNLLGIDVSINNTTGSNNTNQLFFQVTDANGCIVSDDIILTIRPNPIVNAGPDTTLCFSLTNSYLLSEFSPLGGVWTNFASNSGTLSGLTFQTGGIGADTLSYTFTDAFGCLSSDTIVVDVTSPISIDAGPDLGFCITDAAIILPMPEPLNPPASSSALWTGPGVESSGGAFTFTPLLAGSGNHTLNYSYAFGATCDASDAVSVYVGSLPQVDIADFDLCFGDTVNINSTQVVNTGTAPFIYNWQPQLNLSNPALLSPDFYGNQVAATQLLLNYSLEVTDSIGCTITEPITITLHPLPVVDAGLNDTLCDQPIPFTLTGYSPTLGGTGVWTGNNLVGDVYTPNGLGNQTLTYTFTDVNGCENSDEKIINVVAPIYPNAGPDRSFCLLDLSVPLLPVTQPGGIWTGAGVSAIAGAFEFTPITAGAGNHELVYTINQGTTCETHDTLIYKVFPMPQVDAGPNLEMCSGDTLTLSGSASLGTLPYQFSWSPITGILSGGSTLSLQVQLTNTSLIDITQSYIIQLTDSAGCTATDSMQVLVHPLPVVDAGLNDTLCDQPIPFTLTGYSPTLGGTGVWTSNNLDVDIYTPNGLGNQTLTYTFTDVNGCENSDEKIINVVAPIYPDAGPDRSFCLLDLSVPLLPVTQPGGIWTGAGVSAIAGAFEFTPLTAGAGTHELVYTINQGTTCETHDTLIYKVFPMPQVDAGPNLEMCSGDTVTLSGSASLGTLPYQFSWTPITGILSGGSTLSPQVQLTNASLIDITQSYVILLTDSAGCTATDSMQVLVHPLPIVDAGMNDTLCDQPIPFTLSGYSPTTGGTGVWSGSNLVGDIYTPNGLGNQTLTYTFTDVNGCENSDEKIINVVAPIYPDAGPDRSFCLLDLSVPLLPVTQPGGIWTGAGVSAIAGAFEFTPLTAGAGTHELVYTINQGTTCETHDTLIYKVFPMPQVDAGPNLEMCSGDTVTLSGSASLGTLPYQFSWSPTTGILSGSSTLSPQVQLTNASLIDITQSYVILLTDSAGCTATDSMQVLVHPLPLVDAGLNDTLCDQPIPFTLIGYSPTLGGTGVWTGNNLDGDIYTPNGLGNHTLTYTFTDVNGCVNSDEKFIIVVAPVFPNAGPDIELCEFDSAIVLEPSNFLGGIWSGTGVTYNIPDYIFNPLVSGFGQFNLTYTILPNTTCQTQDSILITVFELPEVKLGPDLAVCIDDPCFQITEFIPSTSTGEVPPTGMFYSSGIIGNTGLFCPSQNPPGDQMIIYQYTDPNTTCTNQDTMIIQVHPNPRPLFDVDSLICINTSFSPIDLSLGDTIYGGSLLYNWIVYNYLGQEYENYTGPEPQMIITDTGNYILHLTLTTTQGCIAEFERPFSIIDTPTPSFTLSATSGCAPISVAILNNSTGIDINFAWSVDGLYSNSTSLPDSILFPSPILGDTTFIVRLTVSNQCGFSDLDAPFIARPTPVSVPLTDEYIGCSPFVPTINNSSYGSPDAYQWVFSDGFMSTDTVPPSHGFIAIDNDTTVYTVTLIAQNACGVDSSSFEIIALPNTVVAFFNTLPQFGCAPLNVEFSNFSSGANSYTWDFDDGSPNVTTYNANHVFQDGGIYQVSMIATDGCSIDTAYATVNVFPKPDIQFQLAEDVICEGNSISVSNLSQGAAAYLWDFGNGSSSTSFEPSYVYTQQGNYIIQLIGYSPIFGCPDTLSLPLVVQANPQIDISIDPMMGCMPLFVTFTNSTLLATSMEWDFGNGSTSSQFSTSTNYFQFGDYEVHAVAHNYNFANNLDCLVDTNIVISVFPKPESSFNLESNASCGDSVAVSVDNLSNGASSYLWTWQNSNSFEFEPLIAITDTGYFPIQLITSNQFACKDTSIEYYRLTGQPVPDFSTDPAIGCMPLNSSFNSLTTYGDQWEWNFGDGTTSNQGPNVQHEYSAAGVYNVSLRVENDNLCFADTTINEQVIVLQRANAEFDVNQTTITTDYPVVLFENQSTNASIFDLFPGDGTHYTDFINQHVYQNVFEAELKLMLIANNEFNCPDTAYKALKIEPSREVYIPNSFTPNGDGRNDLFGPVFDGEVTFFNFLIFDRWGHIVFETVDVNEKWNGTFRNLNREPIKQDVYVYKIVFGFGGSFESYYSRVGNVTLIY